MPEPTHGLACPEQKPRSAESQNERPSGNISSISNELPFDCMRKILHPPTIRHSAGPPVDFSRACLHIPPMSNSLPPKPRIVGPKVRICIVASKYNEQFTDALVDNAIEELAELVPQGRVDLVRVPGAFEIPVAVASVIDRDPPACVIALGLIIRGSTAHADLVASSVTDALQRIAVDTLRPIIHEVLLVEDEKQAYARCIGTQLNRGREAARAAAVLIDVFHELDRSMPRNSVTKKQRNA